MAKPVEPWFNRRPPSAEPEQPQPRRDQGGSDSREIRGTVAGQYVSQEMVVDDNRGHQVVARSGSSSLFTDAG